MKQTSTYLLDLWPLVVVWFNNWSDCAMHHQPCYLFSWTLLYVQCTSGDMVLTAESGMTSIYRSMPSSFELKNIFTFFLMDHLAPPIIFIRFNNNKATFILAPYETPHQGALHRVPAPSRRLNFMTFPWLSMTKLWKIHDLFRPFTLIF